MTNHQKDESMRYKMTVKKAGDLEVESYVVTPQHPTGLLLVHMIDKIEEIDDYSAEQNRPTYTEVN